MKTNNKLNEGIRLAKEGIEECWDDMEGQEMTSDGNGEQMSVTISMPGKNISVTTDSADEIGNILRLAGITLGGEAPMGDVDGDGDHDITDHAAEIGATEPEVMYVGANSGEMSNSGDVADMSNSGEDEQEEKIADEAVGDISRTSKGGTVTQTSTGQVHKAGPGNYGGSEEDHEDDTPVPAGAVPEKEEDEEVKESGMLESKCQRKQDMTEGVMSEIHMELSDIVAREDFDALYDLFSANTPTGRYVQDMVDDVVVDYRLHPDDDFEKIEEIIFNRLEEEFGDQGVAEGGKTPKQYWNRDSQSIGSTPDDGLTYADPDEDGVQYPDYGNTNKSPRKFRVKDNDGFKTTDTRYRVDPKTKKLIPLHRISIENESVNLDVVEDFATLRHYKAFGVDLVELIASMDGVEVQPDDDAMTSATITIDVQGNPDEAKELADMAKQGKIKPVGGPTTRDMAGKARRTGTKYITPPAVVEGESARILQLAGVTNEAQSAAQKAAFAKMIAAKGGKKSDDKAEKKDDNKKPDDDGDGIPDWADKDKEVKEDAPANNIYGQGVYEGQQEYSRILALAGIAESKLANSPEGTSMPEPKLFDNLPSARGEAAGRKDYGANRANGQGENPMGDGTHTVTVEEQFETAMGEYRKFVSENIARKK